jgi:hypothetical protein
MYSRLNRFYRPLHFRVLAFDHTTHVSGPFFYA